MTNITIYDPAMCCSSGVCGADVDQALVDFASNLDWLSRFGANVTRYNLSQEPARFADNEAVRSVLEKSGVEGLPVIIADASLKSSGRYPSREELAQMAGLTAEQIAAGPSASAQDASSCCSPKAAAAQSSSGGCCGGDEAEEQAGGCCA